MPHILDQDETWTDRNKVEHRIAEMDGRHAVNIYEMLKRQHKHLAREYVMGYLLRLHGPEGEMAAEAFERAVEDQIEYATEKPFLWLLDKPLLKALARRIKADRIAKGWDNPNPEPNDPDYPDPRPSTLYEPREFEVRPLPDFDEDRFAYQRGDENRVFITTAGVYEDTTIKGVFVGNRTAAHRLAAELERYNDYAHAAVQVWDDTDLAKTMIPGVPGKVGKYRYPWSRVEYRTIVDLETAEVLADFEPEVEAVIDSDPGLDIERDPIGRPGRYSLTLITRGPDGSIDKIRSTHADLVNTTIAQVLADTKGGTQ